MNPHRARRWHLEKARLIAAIAAACTIGAGTESAWAKTWLVNTCGERVAKGITPLRYACTHATSGDVVDLSGLTCSTITLTAGEIPISTFDLTVQSAPDKIIAIDAGGASRIFTHTVIGKLDLRYLYLEHGAATMTAYTNSLTGGCVYNRGSLYLRGTTVFDCSAAFGGCIAATASGSVSVQNSILSTCAANFGPSAIYAAGALLLADSTVAYGHFTNPSISGSTIEAGSALITHSTIRNNLSATNGNLRVFGALTADHMVLSNNSQQSDGCLISDAVNVSISYSSIENNYLGPGTAFGAALCVGIGGTATATVTSTTIAGASLHGGIRVGAGSSLTLNDSTIVGHGRGGIAADQPAKIAVRNSTISSNGYGIGISAGMIDLQSSIVARNATAKDAWDLYASASTLVSGSNNLIMNANVDVPAGTLRSDPRLTALAMHGGPTRTVGLSIGSPAINAGNNGAVLANDQRGTDFARVVGAAADIGAYERQANDDELFYGGFD